VSWFPPCSSTLPVDGLLRKRDSLLRLVKGLINPGKLFDLTLPLEEVAEGYRTMDERRAIKTLLRP
jgi:threonine dehydrogenase-like Zn-dependent dehydrogenase